MPAYKREPEIEIEDDIIVDPTAPPEEKTWAKRYADLRRKEGGTAKENLELKAKLEEAQRKGIELPSADDAAAIDEWIGKYPDLAKIVSGIADRRASEVTKTVADRVKELAEKEATLEKEKSDFKLREVHPDFDDIINAEDGEFHKWLAGKSRVMQDAIYVHDDWEAAADVVEAFKLANPKEKPVREKRNSAKDLVRAIPANTFVRPTGSDPLFSESQINSMSIQEYEHNEEAINKAWREGKVLLDITGGAR